MTRPLTTIVDFLEPAMRQRLPQRLLDLWSTVEVSVPAGAKKKFSIRASSIDECWFCGIEGDCVAQVREIGSGPAPDDYALLALMMSGRVWLEGETIPIERPGEIALYRWGGPYGMISSGEFRYLIAHIPIRVLGEAAQGNEIPFGRTISAHRGTGAIIASALRALASEASAAQCSSLARLLPGFARLVVDGFAAEEISPSDTLSGTRLTRVRDYMEAHFADPKLTPGIVARACGMSERQIFRMFGQEGTSFSAMLRQIRLEYAMAGLTQPRNRPIGEIAHACGFSSAAHFARVFREAEGRSPSEYRRSARSGLSDSHPVGTGTLVEFPPPVEVSASSRLTEHRVS